MARVPLPESRLKARRRKRRLVTAALWALMLVVVVGGVVGLTYLPHWRVAKVTVAGVEGAEAKKVEQQVRAALQGRYFLVVPRDNVLFYPYTEIVGELVGKNPTFASVEVRATSLRALEVQVVEREPVALWCGTARVVAEPCLLLDERGIAYEPAPQFGGVVYTEYYGAAPGSLPRQYLNEEAYRSLRALVAALETAQGLQVASVEVDEARDARLRFANNFELIFSLDDGGGDVYERFALALGAEPFVGRALIDFEYLDLRFGDRLYYKLKAE